MLKSLPERGVPLASTTSSTGLPLSVLSFKCGSIWGANRSGDAEILAANANDLSVTLT